MTLQAKLTLGTVLLATVIVAINSMVYLGNIMDLQFESALLAAERVGNAVLGDVKEAVNSSRPDLPLSETLTSDRLTEQLQTEVALDRHIVEVAVVDADHKILADNFVFRRGQLSQKVDQLAPLVQFGWIRKVKVLLSHDID